MPEVFDAACALGESCDPVYWSRNFAEKIIPYLVIFSIFEIRYSTSSGFLIGREQFDFSFFIAVRFLSFVQYKFLIFGGFYIIKRFKRSPRRAAAGGGG